MSPSLSRGLRWGLFALALALTVGSFSLSLVGGWTPCIYCLTLRYTGLAATVIALVHALRPQRGLAVLLLVFALGAIGVSGYLLNKDLRKMGVIRPDPLAALTQGDTSCAPGQDCSTPLLLGLPFSSYAMAGFLAFGVGTVLTLRSKP